MIKKLFSHTAIYGLAPQIAKLANFFVLPIITQDLTEIDFGVAGVMTAYTSAIAVLALLGLRIILVNSFFKSPGQYKWAWRQIYGFLICWNFIYAALLGALIFWVVPQEALENRWLIVFLNVAPLVVFGPTSNIGITYYQVNQKPIQIGIRTALLGILGVLLNLYFISYLKMGYMGWFWAAFIVGICSNFSYWYPMNFLLGIKPIFNFKWRLIKNSLKVSLPTVPHYYSGYLLNSSDKMVMDLLKVGTGDIGKYNVAYTVGNLVQQIGDASGLAVGPIMMEKYNKGDDIGARNLIFVLQALFLFGTFLLCIWLKEAFQFLIRNETLALMYPLGIIIIMGYNYRPMYLGANNKLFYTEKTNVIWKVTFVAGLLNVGLNLVLIPIFGFEVAAYTTFASLMFMGYFGFYLKVFREINAVNYYPLYWLSLTLLLSVLAFFLVELPFPNKLVISVLVVLAFIFLFLKFRKKLNGLS
jgi:O-antigen/teichoic acid export membrane protein